MSRPKVLLQLDADERPSAFDSLVAIDAGVNHLLRYSELDELSVPPIVHGAMFTRGPQDLRHTAIFIGGSDVPRAERLLHQVQSTFFGPFRVSVLFDPNGSNTTAVAAVQLASHHVDFANPDVRVLILGGTGAVGRRLGLLVARLGGRVTLASRDLAKAQATVADILPRLASASDDAARRLVPVELVDPKSTAAAAAAHQVVFAAGAAGVEFLPEKTPPSGQLQVAVDLNAVPPAGIRWIDPQDRGERRGRLVCYGALGVGGFKMKLHRRAVAALFERNDLLLDAAELLELARDLN